MVDRLFLSKDCPDCAIVRAELNMSAVMDDDFRGTDGQELMVFSALSNAATRELLNTFGLRDEVTPFLKTHDGHGLQKAKNIVRYLRESGMSV